MLSKIVSGFVYHVMRFFIRIVYFLQGYRWKVYRPKAKTYMVLSNHTTNTDFFYCGLCFRKNMYFVASEHILRIPFWGKIIRFLVNPIPRKKGASGKEASAEIVRRLSQGDCVCMYVEGSRTFNGVSSSISPNTAKLVHDSKVPLITMKIHGGYMRFPRWSSVTRRGPMWSEVVHEYSVEELEAMTDEELNKKIREDIYVDAFEDQKIRHEKYKAENRAQGIERILYVCPECHEISTIYGDGNHIKCSACSFDAEFDEYGFIQGTEKHFSTITEWDNWQKEVLTKHIEKAQNNEVLFEDKDQILYEVAADRSKTLTERAKMSLFKESLIIGNHIFAINDISHLAITMSDRILFTTTDGRYWEVNSSFARSAVKYQVAVQYLQGKPICLR